MEWHITSQAIMKDKFDSEIEKRAREVFLEILDIGDPSDRKAYLDEACSGNPKLKKKVHALMAAADGSERLFENSLCFEILEHFEDLVGKKIDRYEVIEKLGEGGFGEVFRVEQVEPIHRELALKVIKPGMDSRDIIKRFEAERQALAMMNHPNIAQIVDAGATDNGRPYFVMELAVGKPISRYCDEKRLNIKQRLNMFLQVCDAVQHAHQQGIIHRDLKPSNIVIVEADNGPVPKIIDFGIAKSLQTRLTDQTLVSQKAVFIGTPDYMSPEQITMGSHAIDTRADIYSLGIILYELMVGVRPFQEELKSADLALINQVIANKEPSRPTVELKRLGDRLDKVLENRDTDNQALLKTIHGDLDWITLKAIEKEPGRRYDAVALLAQDIRRFLEFKPVEATPPSAVYLLRKYIRRNRTFVISAAFIILTLLVGLIFSAISYQRESRQRLLAEQSRERAQEIVSYLIEDLQPQLVEVGKRDTLKEAARTAVQYYEKLPPEMRDIKTVREHAAALKVLQHACGWNFPFEFRDPEKKDLWRWSVEEAWPLWRQVAMADPQDGEAAAEALFGERFTDYFQTDFSKFSESERMERSEIALDEYRNVLKRFPDEVSAYIALIRSLRGHATGTQDIDKGTAWIKESCELGCRAMELYPDNDRIKAEYCTSLYISAGKCFARGENEAALQKYLEAHDVFRKKLQDNPSHWGYLVQAYQHIDYYIHTENNEISKAEMIPLGMNYIDRLMILQPHNEFLNWRAGQIYRQAAISGNLDLRKADQYRYNKEATRQLEIAVGEGRSYDQCFSEYIHSLGETGVSAASNDQGEHAFSCLDALIKLSQEEKLPDQFRSKIIHGQIEILMALEEWESAENLLREDIAKLDSSDLFKGKDDILNQRKLRLGDLLFMTERFNEARPYFEQGFEYFGMRKEMWFWDRNNEARRISAQHLAQILLLSEENERAIEMLDWAYSQYHQNVHKRDGLLRSRLRLANAAYLLACALSPNDPGQRARRQELLREAAGILDYPENKSRLRLQDVSLRDEIQRLINASHG